MSSQSIDEEIVPIDPAAERLAAGKLVKLIDAATPYRSSQPTLEQRLVRNKERTRAFTVSWLMVTVAVLAIVGLIARHL